MNQALVIIFMTILLLVLVIVSSKLPYEKANRVHIFLLMGMIFAVLIYIGSHAVQAI